MKKWIIGLFCLCVCLQGTWGQRVPAKWLPWSKEPVQHLQSPGALQNFRVSRQLEKRLNQTYRQATQAQSQLPAGYNLIMGEPVQKVLHPQELNPAQLYPAQTFLTNSNQTAHYLAARNNRLFLQEMRRMEKVWKQIEDNLPRFQQEAAATEQPEDPVRWLEQQLPFQTTQLFIGEAHGYSEIHESVAQLLQHLRAQQPQRHIILFTEFLPENFVWKQGAKTFHLPTVFHKFFPIWERALEQQISVIGLELPAAVDDYCTVRYLNQRGALRKQSVWASLEGMRLRNVRWEQTLNNYRAQFPDALFIIYTGADHVMYNRPFTLAGNKQEKTFVAILYPDKKTTFQPTGRFVGTLVATPAKGPLEQLVDNLDLQRAVIRWQSPDLPSISGFDVRIKVPVTLEGVDY